MDENLKDFDLIKKIMVLSGQWHEFSTRPRFMVLFQKFRVLYIILLAPLPFVSTFLSDFVEGITNYAVLGACAALVTPVVYSYIFEWDLAKRVYNRGRSIVAKNDSKEYATLLKAKTKPVRYFVITYGIFAFLFTLLYAILPYFYDAYLAWFTESDKPFMTPLPHHGLMGKEPKRTFSYYCSNVLLSLWHIELTIILFAFDSFVFLIVIYAYIELEILKEKIKKWAEKPAGGSALREIIEDHNQVLRLKNDISLLLGGPIVSQNTIGSIGITIFAYTVIKKFQNGSFTLIMNAFALGMTSAVISTACFVGAMLEEQGEKLSQTLYDIPWYNMSKSDLVPLRIMMNQAARPVVINFKGWNPLNLVTLKNVINATYSYFMLLNSIGSTPH